MNEKTSLADIGRIILISVSIIFIYTGIEKGMHNESYDSSVEEGIDHFFISVDYYGDVRCISSLSYGLILLSLFFLSFEWRNRDEWKSRRSEETQEVA